MKKLIIDEVNSFRAEVRAQARATGQIRRQDRQVISLVYVHDIDTLTTASLSPRGMSC